MTGGAPTFQNGIQFAGNTLNDNGSGVLAYQGANLATEGFVGVAVGNVETYAPGNPNDWGTPVPSTKSEAIDRLAAALRQLTGNPV